MLRSEATGDRYISFLKELVIGRDSICEQFRPHSD